MSEEYDEYWKYRSAFIKERSLVRKAYNKEYPLGRRSKKKMLELHISEDPFYLVDPVVFHPHTIITMSKPKV